MNHASAIIRWREHIDRQPGGFEALEQKHTVTTMLFACHSWLQRNAADASQGERDRIETIKGELEGWMKKRGLTFNG